MCSQLTFLEKSKSEEKVALDWDFKNADTQYLTHGLHPYPARMIPQIAAALMDIYLPSLNDPLVVDVFCGSGTVNVEASLKGYRSIGVDLNPFAVLLSAAKTTKISNSYQLTKLRHDLFKKLESYEIHNEFIPKFKNLQHWFKADVIKKLSYLRYCIELENNIALRNILFIIFANTLMKSSNVDWKSSRYIRVFPKEKLESHSPDVFQIFRYSFLEAENRIKKYSNLKLSDVTILRDDARSLPLESNSVDIIITSPPYGEERNTIPYIRWSKLFLLWLGFEDTEISQIEKTSLGGIRDNHIKKEDIPSKTFWKAVKDVQKERINEAIPFMLDYLTTLREMRRILKPKRRCCIVIGHRSISRNLIDMGKVTSELAVTIDFKLEDIFGRTIPKKMIPWTTPTGETIFDESIVVLRKNK